jgi:hypothetical protein
MTKKQELEEYFQFTQDDLTQNKKGIVSENQKKEVMRRRLTRALKTLILLALIISIAAIIVAFNLRGASIKIPSALWVRFFLVLAVIVGIIFFPAFKKQDFALKSAHGKVDFVRVVKQEVDDSRSNSHTNWTDPKRTRLSVYYEMHIEDRVFDADDKLMEIVPKGDICRVYYIGSGTVISMEVPNQA